MKHLVLMGLMGSGKTSVATIVARRLGVPMVDSDASIEAATHETARQLAQHQGADALHEREARQLLTALESSAPSVIAAAASTIEDERCRRTLASADVVYLRVEASELVERFSSAAHRPDFGRPIADLLAEQYAKRDPLFRAAATLVLDEGSKTPTELAEAVIEALQG